jgi:uncharacterized membrane protein YgaE (UPF0421/DUF939 family)
MGTSSRARAVRAWQRLASEVTWTRPTWTELGTVAKAGLAAGLAWWLAHVVTDEPSPVLASLTAVVVVQVSIRGSLLTAVQRSAAVVLGVLVALAIGHALDLNAITVALLVAVSLGVAELVLRLPRAAARQVPVSVLVVLSTVSLSPQSSSWHRATDTVLGAMVGVVVSFALPASTVVEARLAVERLAAGITSVLEAMGSGLQEPWSTAQTEDWRRTARTVRERLVGDAVAAVDSSSESVRWNVRDRLHTEAVGRYEAAMPRLERAAIGVSVIARGLDDHARLTGTMHAPMRSMGELFNSLAAAIDVLAGDIRNGTSDRLAPALERVRQCRERCVQAASRRARAALEAADAEDFQQVEGEWLSYAALLVQVDRIVADLAAPLPT